MSSLIINVNKANFEYEVIEYSMDTPVLVDFWAEWCVPCKTLDPILVDLVTQGDGSFRLARLNVDENPDLTLRFNVTTVPAVKAFREGSIVAEFSGLKPREYIAKFLRLVVPSTADIQLDKGDSMLQNRAWQKASQAYQSVLEERPQHPRALLGYAKALLAQGQGEEAAKLLNTFPPSHEYTVAEQLQPLAKALTEPTPQLGEELSSIEATYRRSLHLIRLGNLPAAIDGLLEVLRQDKHYHDDAARKIVLALFEILGRDNPTTQQYQKELASILF
jgi:putative thioredoxin